MQRGSAEMATSSMVATICPLTNTETTAWESKAQVNQKLMKSCSVINILFINATTLQYNSAAITQSKLCGAIWELYERVSMYVYDVEWVTATVATANGQQKVERIYSVIVNTFLNKAICQNNAVPAYTCL